MDSLLRYLKTFPDDSRPQEEPTISGVPTPPQIVTMANKAKSEHYSMQVDIIKISESSCLPVCAACQRHLVSYSIHVQEYRHYI